MDKLGQIIAIGGGGFGRNHKHNKIEKYILSQTKNKNPKIIFIPTASAEDASYIVNFYSCFNKLNCEPSHLIFFKRTPKLDSLINQADIIYVGGGNTKSMLAVWREWKFDRLLLKAYKNGKILCGVSAGAICWFEQGITDSWASNLNTLDCLGFIDGMACPHYQEEKDRRPTVKELLLNGTALAGYAIDGGAAVHFKDGKYLRSLQFYPESNVYYVKRDGNMINESQLDMTIL
tara:strand:- start:224 stop:922 length:699 start_codon:yes stop_codon:yes gene_type:complete